MHSPWPRTEPVLTGDANNKLPDFGASLPVEPETKDPHRPVYPYSVVAGGVRSPEELKLAIAKDPIVAEHYAGFDSVRAHLVKLREAKLAYVSYRLGNKVFWTKKKIRLAKGEPLITDGESYARTRCANRVSEKPQPRTSSREPSPKELDKPIDPASREVIAALIPPIPTSPPVSGIDFVPVIPLVPLFGGNPPPVPVTPTPEPGTLLLVGSGLAGLAALRRKFKP